LSHLDKSDSRSSETDSPRRDLGETGDEFLVFSLRQELLA